MAYLISLALNQKFENCDFFELWGLIISGIASQADFVNLTYPETRVWVKKAHFFLNNNFEAPPFVLKIKEILQENYISSDLWLISSILNMAKRHKSIDPKKLVKIILAENTDDINLDYIFEVIQKKNWVAQQIESLYSEIESSINLEKGYILYKFRAPDELAEPEGPLASKLVQKFNCPVILFREEDDKINLQGRAPEPFSFEDFINNEQIRQKAFSIGGHKQAIGGTVFPEKFTDFIYLTQQWLDNNPYNPSEQPHRLLNYILLDDKKFSPKTAYLFGRRISPFGNGFKRPIFKSKVISKDNQIKIGEYSVLTDRSISEGHWYIKYYFDEAICNGENIGIKILDIEPISSISNY